MNVNLIVDCELRLWWCSFHPEQLWHLIVESDWTGCTGTTCEVLGQLVIMALYVWQHT